MELDRERELHLHEIAHMNWELVGVLIETGVAFEGIGMPCPSFPTQKNCVGHSSIRSRGTTKYPHNRTDKAHAFAGVSPFPVVKILVVFGYRNEKRVYFILKFLYINFLCLKNKDITRD
jgi:hypothetical protein